MRQLSFVAILIGMFGLAAGCGGDGTDGCTPDCAGVCGGADGCSGTCPDNCVAPETCGGGGTTDVCGQGGCTSDCTGVCGGADGCGDTCPDNCIAPEACGGAGTANVCGEGGCTPACVGACGGSDGCGGTCPDNCCTSPPCYTWEIIATPTAEDISAIWIDENDEVWMATNAAILRFVADSWAPLIPVSDVHRIGGIYRPPGGDLFVGVVAFAPAVGTLMRLADTTLEHYYTIPNCPDEPPMVHGADAEHVYFGCGYYSGFARANTITDEITVDEHFPLDDAYALSPEQVIVVTNSTPRGILLYEGGALANGTTELRLLYDPSAAGGWLMSVWAAEINAIFAASRTAVHWTTDGTEYLAADIGGGSLAGGSLVKIWGASATSVFAVGTNGLAVFYNGVEWTRLELPSGSLDLAGIAADSQGDVWIVGAAGTLLKGTHLF